MSLRDAIAAIIEQRHARKKVYESRKGAYSGIYNNVEKIMTAIDSIDAESADVVELLSPAFVDAIKSIRPDAFMTKYNELIGLIESVCQRYEKSEINISVVGAARQGKSSLLQSISGLDNNIIPAFSTGDCTGAISIIKNCDEENVTAKVFFFNKAQMVERINAYITAICEGKNIVPLVKTIADIETINIDKLREFVMRECPANTPKLEQLEKHVIKYAEWNDNVIRFDGGGCLELNDKTEIIKYVAQYNGKAPGEPGREEYYNYLAVSKVEISCPFNFRDAGRIVLRDTIGLGDEKQVGLTDAMLSSVASDCDAAIVIKFPKSNSDNLRESDFDIYRTLEKSCTDRGLDMNKWFFFVVNHSDGSNDTIDNTIGCRAVEDQLAPLRKAGVFVTNVTDEKAVTDEILIPMLTILKGNLPQLDKALEEQVEAKAREVYREYEKIYVACLHARPLCRAAENISRGHIENFDEIFSQSARAFSELREIYKKKCGTHCEELRASIDALAPDITSDESILPTEAQIVGALTGGGTDAIATNVVANYLDKLRTDFTRAFVEMDDVMACLVYKLQREVVEILSDKMRFDRLVCLSPDETLNKISKEHYDIKLSKGYDLFTMDEAKAEMQGKQYSAWIGIAHDILDRECQGEITDDILLALEFMSNFTISVRSFLLHRVRACIDILDPESNTAPIAMMTSAKGDTPEEKARLMRDILSDVYIEAYENMVGLVSKMYYEPNQLLYSAIAEFSDRLFRSFRGNTDSLRTVKSVWETLYREKQKVFDRERYNAFETANLLLDNFDEIIKVRLTEDQFLNIV